MFEEEPEYTPTAKDLARQATAQQEKHDKRLNGLKDGSRVFYRKKYTRDSDAIIITGAESAQSQIKTEPSSKIVTPKEVIDAKLGGREIKIDADVVGFAREMSGV